MIEEVASYTTPLVKIVLSYRWRSCSLLKTNVYKTPVEDLDHLKTRITEEIQLIKKETFHDVFLEIEKRLNFCIDVKGDTCEQYL